MLEAWILLPLAPPGISEGTGTAAPSNLPWTGPLGAPDRPKRSRRANGLAAPIEVASSPEGPCCPGPSAGSYSGQSRRRTAVTPIAKATAVPTICAGGGTSGFWRRGVLLAERDWERYWYPRARAWHRDRDQCQRSRDRDRLRESSGEGRLNSSRCRSLRGAGERCALSGASSRRPTVSGTGSGTGILGPGPGIGTGTSASVPGTGTVCGSPLARAVSTPPGAGLCAVPESGVPFLVLLRVDPLPVPQPPSGPLASVSPQSQSSTGTNSGSGARTVSSSSTPLPAYSSTAPEAWVPEGSPHTGGGSPPPGQ
ncbi:hypothetical protein UY3_10191 [Chelonia mydas]|uniref:Uncharacterized protein n=1 Tax=Chelonia mydas TaxID=8469 RepID=M7B423_CHEMY|nr:hypothetical protein UY3_10191 [Chelonia mydas]